MVELATDNLAALPAEWIYDYFGNTAPPSVWDRFFLTVSLAYLGRFAGLESRPFQPRHRRTLRGVQPMISAACIHVISPLIARSTTSRIVMARSRATSG